MSVFELKIGIVLNYNRAEKKKDELFCVNQFPWLGLAKNEKFKQLVVKRKKQLCVPADVAIGLFLESLPNNESVKIIVDYISPDEISTQRFNKNDIVFVIIYDLLESFHLSNKNKFEKFKHVLKVCKNVYPPYSYQKFINNKCTYYKYLADKKIPVAPTHCVTQKKWFKKNEDSYTNKLLKKAKDNKWKSIIAKPVYGQESKDFAKFVTPDDCQDCEINHLSLKRYLSKNMPKYKSIVIQEYIPGFDKSNPEYRTYFIDGIYAYTVVTTDKIVETPRQEGGKFKISTVKWNYIMRFSKRVMDSLPKLDLPGLHRNPILTRIDIGTGLEGVPHTMFVNEVEFVPSLYIEDHDFPIVEEIAKSLLSVAFEYRFAKQLPINVKF